MSETGVSNRDRESPIQPATAEPAREVLPALGPAEQTLTQTTAGNTPSIRA